MGNYESAYTGTQIDTGVGYALDFVGSRGITVSDGISSVTHIRTLVVNDAIDQGDNTISGTLAWHITDIAGSDATIVILPGTYTITTNITVPATITLEVMRGGIFDLVGTMTVNGSISAGPYRIFDGTLSNLTLTGHYEINAAWAGVPDGSADQSTDLQGLIDACAQGTDIVFPTFSSAWKFNLSIQTANLNLRGMGAHSTDVIPNTNANPIFDLEANRIGIKGFHINGNGAGTTVYGIRFDRDATSASGGNVIEDCRIQNVTHGIYVKNNYYNIMRNLKIEDVTYGIYGRNAFNDNHMSNIKFSTADYGISIIYESATDANVSGSNTIEHCAFESLNAGGVGIHLLNVANNRIIGPYFEGVDWPVIDAGGAFMFWDKGAGNAAFGLDGWERDVTKFGVVTGMALSNITDGSTGTVTAIGNGNATNDKISSTDLAGGTDTDIDNEDLIVVDIDATETCKSRNIFIDPRFSVVGDMESFLAGINPFTSCILGGWARKKSGETRLNKTTDQAIAANTEYVIDFSSNYSAWTARPLGKVLISFTVEANANGDGAFHFLYVNGKKTTNSFNVHSIIGETKIVDNKVSGNLEVPFSMLSSTSKYKIAYISTIATKLSVRIHGFWQ